jgi:AcrR family transcriptional regulator
MGYDEKLLEILRSAGRIFSEKGYHAASVRCVAAETGASPAGLYYYFKSKEELLFLVLDTALTSLLDRVKDAASRVEDPAERLTAIVRTHLKYYEEHREEMRVLVNEWKALGDSFAKRLRLRMREYANIVIGAFRELRPERGSREARAAAFGLFGMLSWVDQWYRPGRDLPMDALAERFSGILIEGFRDGMMGSTLDQATALEPSPRAGSIPDLRASILSGPGF